MYFVYAGVSAIAAAGTSLSPGVPNAEVPVLLLDVSFFGGLALLWAGLGLLELRGHHLHNVTGSILSMLLLAMFFFGQDGHLDLEGLLILGLVAVPPIVSLVDLKGMGGSRAFGAALSVDSILLIWLSLSNYSALPGSNTIRGPPQLEGLVGMLAGTGLLAYGILRTIRPGEVQKVLSEEAAII
jgi:hypothetical protein